MHSRIFQISLAPIDKDDYIEESYYWDSSFIGSVADYVNDDTDRMSDIEWLKDCYKDRGISFGADDSGEYFIIEDKVKYFAPKFETFQKALKELSEITIDDFINCSCGMQMYKLKEAYIDEYGFYIDGHEETLETFDAFVHYARTDEKYYIGATIDYHF